MFACLIVTCYLHFKQNDQNLFRATAVTREWNGYGNNCQHRKLALKKKILPPLSAGDRTRDLPITSGVLAPSNVRRLLALEKNRNLGVLSFLLVRAM